MSASKQAPSVPVKKLLDELENFQEIARQLIPSSGEIPQLEGIDIYGEVIPLNGVVGGDHIVFVDFNQRYDLDARIRDAQTAGRFEVVTQLERNRHRAGILLADVAGHRLTDAVLNAMLHQAFLLGIQYELDINGTVSTRLFEHINTRFYNSSMVGKFLTMIYGEISETGTFRFISAAHPYPVVFSNAFDRIMDIDNDRLVNFPPIGTMPSRADVDARRHVSILGQKDSYTVNEIRLMGRGDILLLYSDGLAELTDGYGHTYFSTHLEERLRLDKALPAREIFNRIKSDLLAFSPPEDDISFVVIKKSLAD